MKQYAIHLKDALRLLEDHQPHNLELWKLENAEIVQYAQVVCSATYKRKGTHTVHFPNGQIRAVRDITLRKIDDLRIY